MVGLVPEDSPSPACYVVGSRSEPLLPPSPFPLPRLFFLPSHRVPLSYFPGRSSCRSFFPTTNFPSIIPHVRFSIVPIQQTLA